MFDLLDERTQLAVGTAKPMGHKVGGKADLGLGGACEWRVNVCSRPGRAEPEYLAVSRAYQVLRLCSDAHAVRTYQNACNLRSWYAETARSAQGFRQEHVHG